MLQISKTNFKSKCHFIETRCFWILKFYTPVFPNCKSALKNSSFLCPTMPTIQTLNTGSNLWCLAAQMEYINPLPSGQTIVSDDVTLFARCSFKNDMTWNILRDVCVNDTVVFCILLETSHTMARHCCGTPRMVNGGKKSQTRLTRSQGMRASVHSCMHLCMWECV